MKVLPLVLLLVMLYGTARCEDSNDSLLNVIKSEIRKKDSYDQMKDQRIRILKQELAVISKKDFQSQYRAYDKIYNEYKYHFPDSAYVYTRKLFDLSLKMHDRPKQYEVKLEMGKIQMSWGLFKDAFDCLNQVNIKLIDDSLKLKYYELKARSYLNIGIYNNSIFSSSFNRNEAIKALKQAIGLARPGSYEKYKNLAELYALNNRKEKASGYQKLIFNNNKFSSHKRAMAAYDLSCLANDSHETEKLLCIAAIYDIRSSTKETLASFSLGKLLFKQGNLNDAELLLRHALDESGFCENKMHSAQITNMLNAILIQRTIVSENKNNKLLRSLVAIVAVILIIIATVSIQVYLRLKKIRERELIIQRENLHLDKINKTLLENSHLKEEYIGYFFNIISSYILKLEKIKRSTERKIKVKNYQELLKITNEIDIKQERDALFYTFDSVFLKLFPNFISSFNALLRPEDQIWPKDNEVLNTSLRIFALMRLGIKDNQTIANILESAVSTIYTYKIRIKSKALVQGNEFENRIMDIKFVEIDERIPA